MKKLIGSLATLLVVVFMISMNSCEELNDIIPVPSMKATVDGEAWTSIFRLTVVKQAPDPEMITISGTPTASETADKAIIITVNGIDVGEYNLSAMGGLAECAIVYKKTANAADGSDDYYVSYSATVNITKMDMDKKQISGTFSGSLVPSNNPLATEVNITNGTFENLNFQ